MTYIVDIEADGLLEDMSKIHCLCWYCLENSTNGSIANYHEMSDFLSKEITIVGHNFIRFDIVALKRILNIDLSHIRLIDTLAISWYLNPQMLKHGLDEWGTLLGIKKPEILDWKNLPIEEYVYRCNEDVKINTKLWNMFHSRLLEIYINQSEVDRFINYLSFKMDCAREAEEEGWKLDIDKTKENLLFLEKEKNIKAEILSNIMPVVHTYKIISRPQKLLKKDNTPTEQAKKWFNLLKENNLPEYYTDAVKIISNTEKGNPQSPEQLKSYLFSLGWQPDEFSYVKSKDSNEVRKIPQINNKEGELTESVKQLIEQYPELEALDSFGVLKHRIGILKSFLSSVSKNNYVKATINGITNTLRFQHSKPCVNLPVIPKKYWEYIRGVLIASDDKHILVGSDMSSLEDKTKRHYMYYFDPEYVREMESTVFDAHLDVAVLANKISRDEECFYKWYNIQKEGGDYNRVLVEYENKLKNIESEGKNIVKYCQDNSITGFTLHELLAFDGIEQAKQIKILKPIRLQTKKINFGAVYGAGAPKLSITGNMSLKDSKFLHKIYWQRNYSVKLISNSCIVKEINGIKWLFNPVSRFWICLRMEKDKFSSLNQSTGVYAFDTWLSFVRKQGIKLTGQFHDEMVSNILIDNKEETRKKLLIAISNTNAVLKLNVELGISIDFGNSYADIH